MSNHVIHKLNARQIMEMVQYGYNSLNPKDVQNYLQGKKPVGSLDFFYGSSGLKNNLGEAHINDSTDFGAIKETFGGNDPTSSFKYEEDEYTSHGDYQVLGPNGVKDISQKIRTRLESKALLQNTQQNYSTQSNLNNKMQDLFEEEEEPRRKPVNKIKKITDTKKAGSIGYDAGIDYINEFIVLIKNPNSKQRKVVFEKMQEIIESESLFTSESVKYYKGGVNKAEKELWNMIQKKKNG